MSKRKVDDAHMEEHRTIKYHDTAGTTPDVSIVCGHLHFRVHEGIITAKSNYFMKALHDVDMKEKKEKTITLQEKNPHVVQALLYYCYKGKYHDEPLNDTNVADDPMAFNAEMYGYGEEFQMPDLKQLAQNKFEEHIHTTAGTMDKAKFAGAIRIIYESTPRNDRGLREIVVRVTSADYLEMKKPQGFKTLLEEVPFFTADVAESFATKIESNKSDLQSAKTYSCMHCRSHIFMSLPAANRSGRCYHCGKTSYWPHLVV